MEDVWKNAPQKNVYLPKNNINKKVGMLEKDGGFDMLFKAESKRPTYATPLVNRPSSVNGSPPGGELKQEQWQEKDLLFTFLPSKVNK